LKTAENEKISKTDFDFLIEVLNQSQNFTAEVMAIRVLSQAELSTEMLRDLLRQVIPQTRVSHIPAILDLYKNRNNEDLAKELEFQLLQQDAWWDKLSPDQVEGIFAGLPGTGEILLDSLSSRHAARLESLEIMESQLLSGDVERGRELFFGKAACSTCHAVAERGDTFGPDLTNIGEIRSQHDILEAIIFPSASFAREYETSLIATESGNFTGIIHGFNDGFYEVKLGPGTITKIPENQVVSITSTDRSMMPSGLETSMIDQELSDLMAYLISLPEGL
jgi:putative heme-binding domain-containing protein